MQLLTPRLMATLAGLALAWTAPALAQQAKQDPAAEAQRAAKAERDAKALREEAARSDVSRLTAMVPVDPANVWVLRLSNGATVRIQLRPDIAPSHVERVKTLTRQHFYDGLVFHRVIDGFMAQGGDPKGDGTGGSAMPDLKAEFTWMPHMRGTVAMARSADNDSANSQFFIMFMPRPQLDHHYTVLGRVIAGMDGVDAIARGEPPANPTKILSASIEGDQASAAAPPAAIPPPAS